MKPLPNHVTIPAELIGTHFRDGTLAYLLRLADGSEILLDRRCIQMSGDYPVRTI